ncbi:hypothetical protein [Staphylococcus intermedius]|uniref:Uncharacterized protein n=1 Tax=Staphylococcus intermedius NCTC 11048 TaxID=1141106 RepID=A0A380GA22_STAIN|nr:hypothetical protein [Staphylococcus intermedius]MDK3882541.1 hypothetical protein [Staphylococcus pseudintermedius]SUM47098.1 Uncharacterised protein [Staphylococcus intermedius NCTC 11048]
MHTLMDMFRDSQMHEPQEEEGVFLYLLEDELEDRRMEEREGAEE